MPPGNVPAVQTGSGTVLAGLLALACCGAVRGDPGEGERAALRCGLRRGARGIHPGKHQGDEFVYGYPEHLVLVKTQYLESPSEAFPDPGLLLGWVIIMGGTVQVAASVRTASSAAGILRHCTDCRHPLAARVKAGTRPRSR